jgi:hypothetical protein
MRDGPYDVDAQPDRLGQQPFAVGERTDAFLGKRDDLEVDHVPDHLAYFDERAQGYHRRVGDVDVAAHMQHTVGDVPAQHLRRPADDVRTG